MGVLPIRVTKTTRDISPRRVVVVGNGMVGHRFCKTLRETTGGDRHSVTVLGAEPCPAYDRIRLSASLDGAVDELLLSPAAWYEEHGIDLKLGQEVVEIDRDACSVRTQKGDRFEYDVLVLATGSEPQRPPMDGLDLPGVHMFRDLSDVAAIAERVQSAKAAVVIGGGLLGLEAAKLLRDAELSVEVVEASDHLMSRQLDGQSAAVLQERVEALGVRTHLGTRLSRIERADGRLRLEPQDGTTGEPLHADLIVVATGVRPRDQLAADAGLHVGARGGVIVDDRLTTSDPNIFAIGECALHAGVFYGLVAPGYDMAEVLASNLCGRWREFKGADNSCHLKLLGVPVSAVGLYDREARHVSHDLEGGGRRTLMLDGRRLIGATTVGDWYDLPRVHDAIRERRKLGNRERLRFEQEGELWEPSQALGVSSWPESTVVCTCTGTTRGQLTAAAAAHGQDVGILARCTGASTVCGSCKPLVAELAGAPALEAKVPGRAAVLTASVLAVVVGLVLFVTKPVPFADSISDPFRDLDQLWRDGLLKQISGYVLTGIAAIGGLLSVRKRVRWFRLGSFGSYRALHTIVGTLSLTLLVAHTGFRFGDNLNMALMSVFVGLSVVGGLAGIAAALEAQSASTLGVLARSWRGRLTHVHAALFWPLPLLLALHVFAIYYY